jgi:hypothetical protein
MLDLFTLDASNEREKDWSLRVSPSSICLAVMSKAGHHVYLSTGMRQYRICLALMHQTKMPETTMHVC